ncbi:hypothetical protein OAE42_05555 [Gammaproteobacteria bacterium]|nr:hypothetical protein [Gammaproteobacteria bacterium]
MVVKVSKPEINVREKISELDKPSGTAGQAMLAAETPQEQFNLIGAGRRNLVINGAMMINQRGNATYDLGYSSEQHGGPDRFITAFYGNITINQSSDVPAGYGFEYSQEVLCASTSTNVARYMAFIYRMEGYDSMVFDYGTSKAKHVTLSFWIKSNRACDISVNFENEQNPDRGYQVKQTINSAGTWEKKIVTIPGDTARTLTTGPQKAFCFDIYLSAPGTNYTGGTPSEAWTDLDNTERGTHCSSDFYDSTSNYFRVTGVQLELGKVATPFEHRSYGEELALCERYYQKLGGTAYQALGFGKIYAAGQSAFAYVGFNTKMRASPSVTEGGNGLIVTDRVAYDDTVTSLSGVAAGQGSLYATFHTGVTRSDRHPVIIACKNGASGWLNLDAEI